MKRIFYLLIIAGLSLLYTANFAFEGDIDPKSIIEREKGATEKPKPKNKLDNASDATYSQAYSLYAQAVFSASFQPLLSEHRGHFSPLAGFGFGCALAPKSLLKYTNFLSFDLTGSYSDVTYEQFSNDASYSGGLVKADFVSLRLSANVTLPGLFDDDAVSTFLSLGYAFSMALSASVDPYTIGGNIEYTYNDLLHLFSDEIFIAVGQVIDFSDGGQLVFQTMFSFGLLPYSKNTNVGNVYNTGFLFHSSEGRKSSFGFIMTYRYFL